MLQFGRRKGQRGGEQAATQEAGRTLDPAQAEADIPRQFVQIGRGPVGEGFLGQLSDALVGIEFRGVGRKRHEGQAPVTGQERLHLRGPVRID